MSHYHNVIQQLSAIYPKSEATAMTRMLFEERFGMSLTDLLLGKDSNLSEKERTELQIIVDRLLKNEPIQYVLGRTTFCGMNISVAPGVLIPRPETEELVAWITSDHETTHHTSPLSILDIGTGSGCIALALADQGFKVEAWDISDEALDIAQKNAERLQLSIHFKKEDILHTDYSETRTPYDIIVSNPPYICQQEGAEMERNVLDYEPHLALFVPDNDPLLFYRAIARFAQKALNADGALYYEINRAYSKETAEMLKKEGFQKIEIRKDQFGNDRMIKAIRK
ncbi:MAG: peptide chain release factor N(5)-glutamine methyltransferase [Bacteroidales bacterium]|nr:peptide chain release factor N(5)-glutamine methyltransferase [Bacteroidales bacterium]